MIDPNQLPIYIVIGYIIGAILSFVVYSFVTDDKEADSEVFVYIASWPLSLIILTFAGILYVLDKFFNYLFNAVQSIKKNIKD